MCDSSHIVERWKIAPLSARSLRHHHLLLESPRPDRKWRVLYLNLVIPPASPSNNFLLRNSVSTAHSSEQIDTIIAAYAALVEQGLAKTGPRGC